MATARRELTLDPTVVIMARGVHRGVPWIRYARTTGDEAWTVRGQCNQCGLCVIGAAHAEHYQWRGEPGTPFAVVDRRVAEGRADEPVTAAFPEAMRRMREQYAPQSAGCTLTVGA